MAFVTSVCVPIQFNAKKASKEYDEILVFRNTTVDAEGVPGDFEEITNALTRPEIIATRPIYQYVDLEGTEESWYRFQLRNSTTDALSPLSDYAQYEPDPALSILSQQELIDVYLAGVPLTLDDGSPFADSLFLTSISAAVARIETELQLVIPLRIITEEKHTMDPHMAQHGFWMKTYERPLVDITRIQFADHALGFEADYEDIPEDDYYFVEHNGKIQIIFRLNTKYYAVAHSLRSVHGDMFFNRLKSTPQAFLIDYIAGFRKIPADIKHIIGMQAAVLALDTAGDLLLGAGIANSSISIDGVSQSIGTTSSATNAGYGAKIISYKDQIKESLKGLRAKYTPVSFACF